MKLIIFILFVTLSSCKQTANDTNYKSLPQGINNPVHTNSWEDEYTHEPIDTTDFILFWKQFRQAVLKKDTAKLASMINDSIIDGWFLLRDYKEHQDKLSKSLVLENLYTLFVPEFLWLLKSYDIHKDLYSKRNDIRTRYRCRKRIGDKIYQSNIIFYQGPTTTGEPVYYNTANYRMGYFRDINNREEYVTQSKDLFVEEDFGQLENAFFQLGFTQTSMGIKLYIVEFYSHIDISD